MHTDSDGEIDLIDITADKVDRLKKKLHSTRTMAEQGTSYVIICWLGKFGVGERLWLNKVGMYLVFGVSLIYFKID